MVAVSTQIEIDGSGVAWVAGANVKVMEIALDKIAHGWSPEEIHFQHPGLSLAQVHAALAYYYENQAETDAAIEGRYRESRRGPASPLQARLGALKRAH